ncbi:MAG: flagellar hook protein FlgE [Geminicoccaceae bacterium]|nr:MAG: flagellar hook protein FlgE [Geminicoccaceae bacterium]
MSLFGSLFSSVSGLTAQSKALSMISDNVANVNTTAYRSASPQFANMVTRAAHTLTYSPGGVRSYTAYSMEKQGLIQSSSSPTDVALSGNGLFVVNDQVNGPSEQFYTRAGSFEPDFFGNLRTPSGFYLQGWVLNVDENIVDINALETVNVRQIQGVATATTAIELGANLNADDKTPSLQVNGALNDYAAGNMADWTVNNANGTKPAFTRDIRIYDSLGRPKLVTVGFLKDATDANGLRWHTEVYAKPGDIDTGVHPNGRLAAGTVTFNPNGSLAGWNITPEGGAAVASPDRPAIPINWIAAAGAENSVLDLNFGEPGATNGLTQFASPNNIAFVNQNGAEVGELNGVMIDELGFVKASFTNGEERRLYRLPVATFPNPAALDPRSGNVYAATDLAGQFNLRFAGVGGAGTIIPSSLESSNVDIADEFTKMIITQRAYSASSKIISTADSMLDELIRTVR